MIVFGRIVAFLKFKHGIFVEFKHTSTRENDHNLFMKYVEDPFYGGPGYCPPYSFLNSGLERLVFVQI